MAQSKYNGERLGWHVLDENKNIAHVIHPNYITNTGKVMTGKEDQVREVCAQCRKTTGRNEFGIFMDNFCINCGAHKLGEGPYEVDIEKLLAMEAEANARGESILGGETKPLDDVCGADGLFRKIYIIEQLLEPNGVYKGKHYANVEYREIKEDTEKPDGFEQDRKYKAFKFIGFKAEACPMTLQEIQDLIASPYVIVTEEKKTETTNKVVEEVKEEAA